MKKIIVIASTFITFLSLNAQVTVSTFAGSSQGFADGSGILAQFYQPYGVATDAAGNVYVADTANNKIRKISPTGIVSTLAGSTLGFADGAGSMAQFNSPFGIAVDNTGNVYVSDMNNNRIRKITPTGVVSTLAGSTQGFADGTGTASQFWGPGGLAIDYTGNIYVADASNQRIRKILPSGLVSTLAGSGVAGFLDGTSSSAQFNNPTGVATDYFGNVYVADRNNHKVRKITSTGVVSTFAGSSQGFNDGFGGVAQFNFPQGVATDASGNVFVADKNNYKIRKIASSGMVSTIAGSGSSGLADGTGNIAQFQHPDAVAVDSSDNVFVADYGNNNIRKISQLLAINQNNFTDSSLKIYPNPTQGFVNIEIASFSPNTQVTISDMLGKILVSEKIETSKTILNVNNYKKGIYLVTVSDGIKNEVQKLIVQ